MSTEIVTACIALAGVVASVAISLLTSRQQASIAVERLRREIHQDFSLTLFKTRLEHYPDLYQYLSDFKKVIQYEEVTRERLQSFFNKMQAWDSRHSILFGSDSGKLLYHFRKDVFELMQKTDQELQIHFNDRDTKYPFIKKMAQIELSLKSELGIYAYSSPTDIKEAKQFRSYQEVTKFSNQQTQPKR